MEGCEIPTAPSKIMLLYYCDLYYCDCMNLSTETGIFLQPRSFHYTGNARFGSHQSSGKRISNIHIRVILHRQATGWKICICIYDSPTRGTVFTMSVCYRLTTWQHPFVKSAVEQSSVCLSVWMESCILQGYLNTASQVTQVTKFTT